MRDLFGGVFDGAKVLVTGHTGFKGSWLTLWLKKLGASVIGYSLAPEETSNFTLAQAEEDIVSIIADIRDFAKFQHVIDTYQPEILFHLAAQPLVLTGFAHPKETFDTNLGGTINVLEACRQCPSLKAIVVVTTDKCYENQEWSWGYRENDPLGGTDPYSSSKCMAEHAVACYRHAYFSKTHISIASARAGNVIGGGDFADHRIVPDAMRALLQKQPIEVRHANSVRPWLSVLDSLSGYLWLAACLVQQPKVFDEAWNFGPQETQGITVKELVGKAITLWGDGDWITTTHAAHQNKPEMGLLRLNWDKAAHRLAWRPTYNWEEALAEAVHWFKAYGMQRHSDTIDMKAVGLKHLQNYVAKAHALDIKWVTGHKHCASREYMHEI